MDKKIMRNSLIASLPGCLAHLYHLMMNGIMSEKNVMSQIKSELHTLAQIDNAVDDAILEMADAVDKDEVEAILFGNIAKLREIRFVEQFRSKKVTYRGIHIEKTEEEIPVTSLHLECWYEKGEKQVETDFQRWVSIQEKMSPGVTKGKY